MGLRCYSIRRLRSDSPALLLEQLAQSIGTISRLSNDSELVELVELDVQVLVIVTDVGSNGPLYGTEPGNDDTIST